MKRILVWLSWWVDSAVAAYLLQQQDFDVVGWFMINYTTDDDTCTTKEDLKVAQEVAQHLGIKLHTFDFQEEYHNRIVQYIVDGYRSGLTPNPDVMCNSEVKFKLFLEEWLVAGFDAVATGHYARILYNHPTLGALSYTDLQYWEHWSDQWDAPAEHYYSLLKWIDSNKDQSYFLAGLNQFQLSKAIFPLGNLTKPEIREIAKQAGLPNADRKDSQGICFIGKIPMKQFLEQYIPVQEGNIIDTSGKIVGKHTGARWYTIGQRKWLGVAAAEPLFVIAKDVTTNTITVWFEHEADLYAHDITIHNWHWIGQEYNLPCSCHAKIRYRQADQEVRLSEKNTVSNDTLQTSLDAHFSEPQRAIASWQILVAYDRDIVIGSGVIG